LFSNPVFVQRLFESFVHEDFAREIDFSAMEPYKTKFVTEAFATRESDVIWKARFKERDIYLFLLIEFQSTVDRRMPVRLLRYIAEFYDSISRPRGGKYPAVFPIVLYNGSAPWTAETEVADLIEPSIPGVYIPRFKYYIIEERSFSAPVLLGMRNLVSLLFYAETVSPEELALSMDAFFDILKAEDRDSVCLFSRWLNDYFRQLAPDLVGDESVHLHSGEDEAMLAENFKVWRRSVFEQGREEGIEKGRLAAAKDVALRLLARGIDPDEAAVISGISLEELARLVKN
jgi:predicted transposase/invertase (TIGR01784 family)